MDIWTPQTCQKWMGSLLPSSFMVGNGSLQMTVITRQQHGRLGSHLSKHGTRVHCDAGCIGVAGCICSISHTWAETSLVLESGIL